MRAATRGSALARWQTAHVADLLSRGGSIVDEVIVSTVGDRDTSTPIHAMGGKGVFVKEVQAAVLDGRVDLFTPSEAELRKQLVALPGIGPWTAEVVAMRAARDPDVFPAGDLGIRQAVAALDATTELPSEDECRARAEGWRPHRSLAAQHLWASLHTDDPCAEENYR